MEPEAIPDICRYLKYHRRFKEYCRTLKRKKEDLNRRIEYIELRLILELRFDQKAPSYEVNRWLERAKEIINEIQEIEHKVTKGNCFSRGRRGKLVHEKMQDVIGVYNQGRFDRLVKNIPSGSRMTLPTSELVGQTSVKAKIWEHMIGDKVCKIGVCGIGGIGKTTIMKHIQNQLLTKRRSFGQVIWVTLSREFDVVKLQKDIATALGENLSEHDDKTAKAAVLLKKLKERKKHVLILDNVWERFSLEEVGIPEPTVANGCKLILTTRSMELAQSMDCAVIEVEPLSESEALNLFLNKVGHDLSHAPTLESTLNLVAQQCAGLPLAIVIVARTMKREYDVRTWKDAVQELKTRMQSVVGRADKVFDQLLKFSYDRLIEPKIQNCFLYCALYPQDFAIDKWELIEYWIVEGLIDEMDTRQAMHLHGQAILNRLENNCLLESAEKGKCVKMHDLVREMTMHITSSSARYLVKAGLQLEALPNEQEWMDDLEKVSLMRNHIKEIPLLAKPPKCTTISTLFLQNNKLQKIHESFFVHMNGIKLLDLSYTRIQDLPNSIFNLETLNTLLLHGCSDLHNVPSLAKLGALKKLDLGATGIRKIPAAIEMLVRLRYLDLNVSDIQEMPGGILPKLSTFQHLNLAQTLLKVEEVTTLSKLETLEMRFRNLHDYQLYSSQQRQRCLNNYSFIVGSQKYFRTGTPYNRHVGFTGLKIRGDSLKLPTDIQELRFSLCYELRSLSNIASLKDATDLRCCDIRFCRQIECVFYASFCSTILESIEQLHLEHLDNLSVLLGEEGDGSGNSTLLMPITPGIFSHLKIVQIWECPKLERLFSTELLKHLQNLEKISLRRCSQLVEIVAASGDEEEDKEARKNSIVLPLPKIREISLSHLPQFKSFCNSRYAMICDSLETIYVNNCPNLKRISPLFPQPGSGQPFPFLSLERIVVSPKECWDSLEWKDPYTKNVLERFLDKSYWGS